MISDKIKELHKRMINHKVIDDKAIVELTASELNALLDHIEASKLSWYDTVLSNKEMKNELYGAPSVSNEKSGR